MNNFGRRHRHSGRSWWKLITNHWCQLDHLISMGGSLRWLGGDFSWFKVATVFFPFVKIMTYLRLMEEIPNNHLGCKKNFVNNGKQTTNLNLMNTRFLNDQKYQKKNGLKRRLFDIFFRTPPQKKWLFFFVSSSKDASRSREVGQKAEDCGILCLFSRELTSPHRKGTFDSMIFLHIPGGIWTRSPEFFFFFLKGKCLSLSESMRTFCVLSIGDC